MNEPIWLKTCIKAIGSIGLISLLTSSLAIAQTPSARANATRIERVMEQLGNLEFGAGATGVIQGTLNNRDNRPDNDEVQDGSWSVALEIGAPIGAQGQAFMLIEAGQGEGLTDEPGIAESFFGVNDDAGDSEAKLEVTEIGYEHTLWDERFVITVGKIDLTAYFDANDIANDETTQFLSSGLVNSIAIAFPADNGTGVRLTISPTSWLGLSLGWGEQDADFEDIFNDPFLIGEVDLKLSIGRHQGHYRFYLWSNLADLATFENASETEHNWGVGMSFDQKLLEPVTVFLRLALQSEDVNEVAMAWSAGMQALGSWWHRPDDVVAIAIGQARLSSKFVDSDAAPLKTGDEFFAEAYYRVVWNEHVALSLHWQLIDHAGGNKAMDTTMTLGARAQLSF